MRPARRLLLLLLAVMLVGLLAALATIFEWPQALTVKLLFWILLGAIAGLALLDAGLLRRTIERQLSPELTFALTETTAGARQGRPVALVPNRRRQYAQERHSICVTRRQVPAR